MVVVYDYKGIHDINLSGNCKVVVVYDYKGIHEKGYIRNCEDVDV